MQNYNTDVQNWLSKSSSSTNSTKRTINKTISILDQSFDNDSMDFDLSLPDFDDQHSDNFSDAGIFRR